eukprot:UN27579
MKKLKKKQKRLKAEAAAADVEEGKDGRRQSIARAGLGLFGAEKAVELGQELEDEDEESDSLMGNYGENDTSFHNCWTMCLRCRFGEMNLKLFVLQQYGEFKWTLAGRVFFASIMMLPFFDMATDLYSLYKYLGTGIFLPMFLVLVLSFRIAVLITMMDRLTAQGIELFWTVDEIRKRFCCCKRYDKEGNPVPDTVE